MLFCMYVLDVTFLLALKIHFNVKRPWHVSVQANAAMKANSSSIKPFPRTPTKIFLLHCVCLMQKPVLKYFISLKCYMWCVCHSFHFLILCWYLMLLFESWLSCVKQTTKIKCLDCVNCVLAGRGVVMTEQDLFAHNSLFCILKHFVNTL